MQTFLPYQSFTLTARTLDRTRLGKQRVEAMQIISILNGTSTGPAWRNHPAVRMWWAYLPALKIYYNIISREWINRGYRHSMLLYQIDELPKLEEWNYPNWLTPEFCHAHQSNLIRKMPEHYRPIFGPDVPDNLPYIWPV